jgi:hypothetical protein
MKNFFIKFLLRTIIAILMITFVSIFAEPNHSYFKDVFGIICLLVSVDIINYLNKL